MLYPYFTHLIFKVKIKVKDAFFLAYPEFWGIVAPGSRTVDGICWTIFFLKFLLAVTYFLFLLEYLIEKEETVAFLAVPNISFNIVIGVA